MSPPDRRFLEVWDIALALFLALVASLAVFVYPDGSSMRLLLTAPMILFAPGYLLMQAMLVPKRPGPTRLLHAVLSIGISLAVLGLVALSTAIVRGAFKPGVIVTMMTLTCIGLAVLGGYRRLYYGVPRTDRARRFGTRIPRFGSTRLRRPSPPRQDEESPLAPAAVPVAAVPVAAVPVAARPEEPPLVTAEPASDLPVLTATEDKPSDAGPQARSYAGDRVTSTGLVSQQETQ